MLAGSVIGVALLRARGKSGVNGFIKLYRVVSALTNLCSHITDERALQSEPTTPIKNYTANMDGG